MCPGALRCSPTEALADGHAGHLGAMLDLPLGGAHCRRGAHPPVQSSLGHACLTGGGLQRPLAQDGLEDRSEGVVILGSIRGGNQGTRYTALQTFDAKGDAWGWLDRERRLIDRGDWTPPIERFREAEEERQRKEAARQAAAAVPTIAAYGSQYLERGELAATSRDR